MGVLKKKIIKYNKYVVEIEEGELEASSLENSEDIVIVSKKEYENEIQKLKELNAKLESRELEVKLQGLKIQEKDLEIQKAVTEKDEVKENYEMILNEYENKYLTKTNALKHQIQMNESEIIEKEENYKTELNNLESKYLEETEDLKDQIKTSKIKIEEIEKANASLKKEMEKENKSLLSKIEDEENLKKQIEIFKIGNQGLKNDVKTKEEELEKIKLTNQNILKIKSLQEKEIEELKVDLNRLKNVKVEYNKLINNYKHLQEVANKKDEEIIGLEAKVRKLDHYLLMSLEAINNLKNLGLFNRLLNRVPEGIDELEEDIIKLQPPKEVEIEPIRINKPRDILGEKE